MNKLYFFCDAQGRPAMVNFNGTKYRYLHNLQGDIIGIVDASGNLVVEYKYDAWGKIIGRTGGLASTLGYLNPFRYRGYVYDEETGLYYLRSRYYNPEWGRFINADILLGKSGVLLGHNLFAYCGNNAVRNTDHTGMIYVAAELYTIALSVEDFSDHNFSNSLLSEKFTKRVRDSEVVRDQVKAYINAIPSGETMYSQTEAINWGVVDSIKTLSMSDLDLALAVGNCANFTITVERVDKNGYESLFIPGEKYKVTYKVRDLYDFDLWEGTERHPAVIWLNDTFGYYPQQANVLHEYWYTVTGEYYVFAIN